MSKYEQMYKLLQENNGYMFTAQVEKAGISRTYLAKFVKENHLEKVAKGIYISQDTWMDELYILQVCNPKIVYSGETALYQLGIVEVETCHGLCLHSERKAITGFPFLNHI